MRSMWLLGAAAVLTASPAWGQGEDLWGGRAEAAAAEAMARSSGGGPVGGLTVMFAEPLGEFGDNVDQAWGLGLHGSLPLSAGGPLRFRADLGVLSYGHQTRDVELFGSINAELSTTNQLAFFTAGPELAFRLGPVEPYANAFGGLSYFYTRSSLHGSGSFDAFASSTNHDDTSFTWGGGLGLIVPIVQGRTSVALDLGARYHHTGETTYVTEDGVGHDADGALLIDPVRSKAELMTFTLGVSVGF